MTTVVTRRLAASVSPKPQVEAAIVEGDSENVLDQVLLPHVQAVIYRPPMLPPWMSELGRAVESGAFQVERTVLPCATVDEIAQWLDRHVPRNESSTDLALAARREILALVRRLGALTHASHFMVRIFTEAPTLKCGFHVDTVAPRAPTVGLLRVFNGRGTEYVDPHDVTSMRHFYRHLQERERLGRQLEEAQTRGDTARLGELHEQIESLDECPAFLRQPSAVRVVPSGSIVAFKHVDARYHWSDHDKALAWVHRSPMEGEPRLVVNVSAREANDCRSPA